MAKGSFQENNRQFPRVNLDLKGVYRVLDLERNEGCAEIQNLSHGGLMFISSNILRKGDLLDMTLFCLEFEIFFNAKVVWTEQLGGIIADEYRFGIQYLRIPTMDKRYLSLIIASKYDSKT